eukprot:CAMPEP_0113941388 /NCGR_PEP_ID=MMETSP1339-20121228/7311_1 /TAXON_ID=94617 /ORGANISM="Fibrocapsa japonica" /LENGTH=142 /DNA_ID=CAMNT_0000945519 /DNA_START=21 /DNA_END=449 /DNA_ORIENTATION=- /assembly_acc=CAM_ASM_000762
MNSSTIRIGGIEAVEQKAKIHVLPCSISYDGEAKVDESFKASLPPEHDDKEPKGVPQSFFRGRKLMGRDVILPPQVRGVVFQEGINPEAKQDGEEDRDQYWGVQASFDEMRVWGHDQVIGPEDCRVDQALEWMALAQQIHAP